MFIIVLLCYFSYHCEQIPKKMQVVKGRAHSAHGSESVNSIMAARMRQRRQGRIHGTESVWLGLPNSQWTRKQHSK